MWIQIEKGVLCGEQISEPGENNFDERHVHFSEWMRDSKNT